MSSATPTDNSSQSTHDASAEAVILLIEDGGEAHRDLSTILGFLGETVVASTTAEYRAVLGAQGQAHRRVSLVVLGECRDRLPQQVLIDLAAIDSALPYIVIADEGEVELDEIDSAVRLRIIARLPSNCGFQPLLDALHKSKLFNRHSTRLLGSDQVRDYNMFRSLVGESVEIERVRKMMGQVANT